MATHRPQREALIAVAPWAAAAAAAAADAAAAAHLDRHVAGARGFDFGCARERLFVRVRLVGKCACIEEGAWRRMGVCVGG